MKHEILWDFMIQTDHSIQARRPNQVLINKKKETCHLVDFDVPADNRVNMKEDEKKKKWKNIWTLPENWKKLWNMASVITILSNL